MSSRGEIKTSLRLMIYDRILSKLKKERKKATSNEYIFVLDMFEQLQLAIGTFTEDRSTERFHDLLDRDGSAC